MREPLLTAKVSDSYLKLVCLLSTSAYSALEVLHIMRYINLLRGPYLLYSSSETSAYGRRPKDAFTIAVKTTERRRCSLVEDRPVIGSTHDRAGFNFNRNRLLTLNSKVYSLPYIFFVNSLPQTLCVVKN